MKNAFLSMYVRLKVESNSKICQQTVGNLIFTWHHLHDFCTLTAEGEKLVLDSFNKFFEHPTTIRGQISSRFYFEHIK